MELIGIAIFVVAVVGFIILATNRNKNKTPDGTGGNGGDGDAGGNDQQNELP